MAEEAVSCCEHHLYRAAVVFSWVTAVALLYRHVVTNHLPAFNAEASRRFPAGQKNSWKAARSADDLSLMKEDTFLDVLQSISVLGKNVKTQLKHALDLRNGCGHPNTLKLGEAKVYAHIETLIDNVFTKYA
jgi:hypothetical protein